MKMKCWFVLFVYCTFMCVNSSLLLLLLMNFYIFRFFHETVECITISCRYCLFVYYHYYYLRNSTCNHLTVFIFKIKINFHYNRKLVMNYESKFVDDDEGKKEKTNFIFLYFFPCKIEGWRTKWRSNDAASTTTTLSSLTSILSAIFITSGMSHTPKKISCF